MTSSSLTRLRSLFAATKIHATSSSHPKPFTGTEEEITSMVNNFKISCNSKKFRYRHTNSYAATVRLLAAAKKFSLIEEIIEHQKQYTDVVNEGFMNRLVSLYGKSGMFSHARNLFDEMPKLKCRRTVKSFNTLLSACVNCKEFDKVSEIFAEIPENLSIKPNVVSYNTLVKAICEMGSFGKVFEVINEMEKDGVEPNEITFNTLLEAFYCKSMFLDAEKVWEMMRERKVVATSRSYNPKLRALVANDRISEAIEVIDEMKRVGVEPDSFSYNALIKGFCDKEDMEETKIWFREMTKNGSKADRVTYVLIGYLACKKGDIDYAFELCKEAMNGKLIIQRTFVQLVVDELVKESRMEEAKELVKLGNSNTKYTYGLKLPPTQ